jgi:prepilin-type N-terminal cleavage/methylation domain-containing protein
MLQLLDKKPLFKPQEKLMKHQKYSSRQSGFTLIELSIVLVIIGLLLGGVLKGQAMVESAKVKALAQELKAMPTMVYAFEDKFKQLPGDDSAAALHMSGASAATAATSAAVGSGDGRINTGTWVGASVPAVGNESSLFWQHVRLAGLSTGVATEGQGTNAVGGRLGVTSLTTAGPKKPTNAIGLHIACSGSITGSIAKQLDIFMDDGLPSNGNVFAAVETNVPVTANNTSTSTNPATDVYADGSTYTVCMGF